MSGARGRGVPSGGRRRLDIRVGGPTGVTISPDLWGLFLEDINNALDGGLNAQLVRNGDFEFAPADGEGMHPLTAWEVDGHVEVRREDPVHPANPVYLRVVGPAVLSNEGWGGVGVREGDRLRLTARTWLVSGAGDVEARVTDADGAVARGILPLAERGWNAASADLVAERDGRGRLELLVPAGLTVELDAISLRPLGSDGAPLTFRPDLVEALRALNPSFVRFPGGCLAHGLGLDNMYHWKRTIGPVHEREQTWNTWGYHQSRQIGYLEYFELCELLGATPLPVVAAGVCCQNLRGRARAIPDDEMPAYIRDVLDLVEFANGGPDTEWGARRIALGHPEPFGMRYLGLGNEDEITDEFRDRYARIEDAVRAAHPGLTVIGTAGPSPSGDDFEAGWAFARERGVHVVDEHAYRTPRWYFRNVDRYDSYDRAGPRVYFGEYAARTNTVRSALAEAAFMIGMERNGDVVELASYAPLLARIGGTQWIPDLVYFDESRVAPSVNYHVQRLFGAVRGERVLDVAVEGAEPVPVVPAERGTVSVRSASEVSVAGIGVRTAAGGADAASGVGSGVVSAGAPLVLGEVDPRAVEVSLTATRTAGTTGFEVLVGDLEVVVGGWQNASTVTLLHADGTTDDEDGPYIWGGVRTGVPVEVSVLVEGPRVRVRVDGELRHDYERDIRPEHRVVAGAATTSDGGCLVRIVNATDETRDTTVSLPVAGAVAGTLTLLDGCDPDAGEPAGPAPAVPVATAVAGERGAVSVVLPPWSFGVLELSAQAHAVA